MKTTEIVGFRRKDVGSKEAKLLRADGNVPCVLYGGSEIIHFHAPAILFKELFYTQDAYLVDLNIEGVEKKAVLKDSQFHAVSEAPLHVDFLEIFDNKEIDIEVPVVIEGKSVGVQKGGQLFVKSTTLRVKGLPNSLPQEVKVDISTLDLGKSIKVKEIKTEGYTILNHGNVTVVTVIITRALKSAQTAAEAPKKAAKKK